MLSKAYDPAGSEDHIYTMWEGSGAFRADAQSTKEPFTIGMPPPNATGQLHLGHAVMLALEDIFIRFARMRGKEALWIPGTDHASIATESLVIRDIQSKEKMRDPRATLGREKLVSRIRDFVERSRGTIRGQVRKMGASCDWSRERYTLDPTLARCTNEVFKDMVERGVIYRGHRIVNWDPKLQTTISDDEVQWIEESVPFYTFRYGLFQISTARPETKFGDKYVVMHPDDARYAQYKHGETFEAEWINGPVRATVIKDGAVDPNFGTGVMTITPWHDHADFDIAERHGLEKEQIIGFDGKLLPVAGEFTGMGIDEARPKILEKLTAKGLLVKVDSAYVHNKAVSSRGGGAIEPQIKLQWFVDVQREAVPWKGKMMSLKQVMSDVVHSGMIRIIPERFEKNYFHWIDNLHDWCISRQIWWGHRIPVWYCIGEEACTLECREPIVSVLSPERCPHCGSMNLEQDADTLDTWYGVSQWTWSTLVDPELAKDFELSLRDLLEQSPDFRRFHPTEVMETGYDILFFWVARMILMTTYVLSRIETIPEEERIPFRTVYLHGLIRTRDGKKMSKSHPETMIDPLDMIAKYGADALRLSMIVGQSPGNDSRLYEEKVAGYRNFVNKLWNASRFVLLECEKRGIDPHDVVLSEEYENLTLADRALIANVQTLIEDVTDGLQHYCLSEVGERLYSFVWDFFCDWYLELSKEDANINLLVDTLRTILILLHPYCPFVTEELWSSVKPGKAMMLMEQPWPEVQSSLKDAQAEEDLQILIDVITAVRKLRSEYDIPQKTKVPVIVYTVNSVELLESQREHILRLAGADSLVIEKKPKKHPHAASVFLKGLEIHVPLEGLIDLVKERKRLDTERKRLTGYLKGVEKKLKNTAFTGNAPVDVVEAEREKALSVQEKILKIEDRLRSLA